MNAPRPESNNTKQKSLASDKSNARRKRSRKRKQSPSNVQRTPDTVPDKVAKKRRRYLRFLVPVLSLLIIFFQPLQQQVLAHVDPQKQAVRAVADFVDAHEKMSVTLKKLANVVGEFQRKPTLLAGIASVQAFQEAIPEMQTRGRKLLEREQQIKDDFHLVLKKSKAAEVKLRSVSEYYLVKSNDFTDDEQVYSSYLTLSRGAEAAADAKAEAIKYYESTSLSFYSQMRRVERILLFMGDMENYLAMFPNDEAELRIRQQLAELQQFLSDFDELMRSFNRFTEAIEEQNAKDADSVPPLTPKA